MNFWNRMLQDIWYTCCLKLKLFQPHYFFSEESRFSEWFCIIPTKLCRILQKYGHLQGFCHAQPITTVTFLFQMSFFSVHLLFLHIIEPDTLLSKDAEEWYSVLYCTYFAAFLGSEKPRACNWYFIEILLKCFKRLLYRQVPEGDRDIPGGSRYHLVLFCSIACLCSMSVFQHPTMQHSITVPSPMVSSHPGNCCMPPLLLTLQLLSTSGCNKVCIFGSCNAMFCNFFLLYLKTFQMLRVSASIGDQLFHCVKFLRACGCVYRC